MGCDGVLVVLVPRRSDGYSSGTAQAAVPADRVAREGPPLGPSLGPSRPGALPMPQRVGRAV